MNLITRLLLLLACGALFLTAPTVGQNKADSKTTLPLLTADETAIKSIVGQFFDLYSKKDSSAISLLWNDKSPYFAAHKKDIERIFAEAEQIVVKPVSLDNITADGENVKITAKVEFDAKEAKTGKPYQVYPSTDRVVILGKAGNNWQIIRHISAEKDLALRLLKTKSEDERAELLKANNELVNVNLAKALRDEGDRLDDKIPPAEVADIYRLGMSIAEQVGDKKEVLSSLNDIGLALAQTDQDQALATYQKALKLADDIGNKDMSARIYGNIGVLYFEQKSDIARTLENAQKSVAIAEEIGNKQIQANSLALIGNTYNLQGNYQKALEYQQKALAVREEKKDKRGIAFSLNNIGLIYAVRGNYPEAIESFNRSSDLVKGTGAVQLYNLGIVYKAQGDLAKALTAYEQSMSICEKNNSEGCIAAVALNFGDLYNALGDYEQARRYLDRSLAIAGKMSDKRAQGAALGSIAQSYQLQQQYTRALEYRKRALALFEEIGFKSEIVNSLNEIGNIYAALGDFDHASESFEKSLKLNESLGENEKISATYLSIAKLQLAKGDAPNAMKSAEQAKSYYDKLVGMPDNWKLYLTLGQAHQALGHLSEARHDFERAVSAVENLRASIVGNEEEQRRFLDDKGSAYDSLIAFLVGQREDRAAFEYSERMRSRALLDALQNGRASVTNALSADEKEHESRLKNELVSLNAQISKENGRPQPDKPRLSDLQKNLDAKRLEFEDLQTRLYAAHPELRNERGEMRPIKLDDAADLVPDRHTAIAEFAVAGDKSFLFLISKNAAQKPILNVFPIGIGAGDLGKKVEAYREKLASGDLDFQPMARELYTLLLKPAATQLAGKTNVIIVPDGPLWNLPLQTLQNEGGKYLIEQASVSYAPSLTALKEMAKNAKARKPGANYELIAFGNPVVGKATTERVQRVFMGEGLEPLPEAERLVNELGEIYGPGRSKIYTGERAREETAKSEAPKYRIVQFATHGILNNSSPMYSHLVLAQNEKDPTEDGLLEAWEMKDLDLKADMVILSACDTARGRISNGEGVIGMSWAMFIAGTPTTVASQWKVESSSTTELMLEFHRQLLSGKVLKAEALRRAELKLMRTTQYKHPSYWAGFVIVGDGS